MLTSNSNIITVRMPDKNCAVPKLFLYDLGADVYNPYIRIENWTCRDTLSGDQACITIEGDKIIADLHFEMFHGRLHPRPTTDQEVLDKYEDSAIEERTEGFFKKRTIRCLKEGIVTLKERKPIKVEIRGPVIICHETNGGK